ncbi:proline racemase [Penicillium brasilianum]|uniref:trans-L-3-hydroxyproline dehydratase n=1 Tax=Penicillium brasilianum TaxID=104259 RepID=A0A1S9S0G8_PENBI|nr:proline racemase [Penicillium brasilianum]
MDLSHNFDNGSLGEAIKCIDMHTTGEPTRIIYSGFPPLQGTLLEQREQAMNQYDHIRKRIMLEPRGHYDMYGAILTPETELVQQGLAHIGTLFTHNGGFSTMCGHATIALGRFLVDTHDLKVFPKRNEINFNAETCEMAVNIHAPCGLVRVTVPTSADGQKSDPSRPVSFLSTPAFAAAINLEITIPKEIRWPEFGDRESVTLDISYGGAYYALVDTRELGFAGLKNVDLGAVSNAASKLKAYLMTHPLVTSALQHPEDARLSFLYSVMVIDRDVGSRPEGVEGVETGLCFFADDEIDRSPTGSCVAARMALAQAKNLRSIGQKWAYNSIVSNHFAVGAFVASIVDDNVRVGDSKQAVIVRVEGKAYYTGTSNFILEEGDLVGESGFTLKQCVQ